MGQQITLTSQNASVVNARITLLKQRAEAGECDLVVQGATRATKYGFLYDPTSHKFVPNRTGAAALSETALRALTRSTELTFTAVPVGSGERIGLDRDSSGNLDGDA